MIKRQLKTSNKIFSFLILGIFSFLILGIFLISFVSASQQQNFGVVKQNSEIDLAQICADCTYNNVTSIVFPNKTILVLDASMTKRGSVFNYTFNQTSSLGEHFVNGIGDPQGINTIWAYPFEVTPSGKLTTTGESILYFIFILIMFGASILIFYFILVLPSGNERDENGAIVGIVKLKYLRMFLIALFYPVTIIILNLLNGLAVNFVSLSIFAGTFGFLFEVMLRGAWIYTFIILLWVCFLAVKDSNISKEIKREFNQYL